MQNQGNSLITFDTELKTALIGVVLKLGLEETEDHAAKKLMFLPTFLNYV